MSETVILGKKLAGGYAVVPLAADGLSIPVTGVSFTVQDWNHIFTTALAASLVIKATPGTLGYISGRIDSTAATATYYLQLWNLAALPADATAVTNVNSLGNPLKIVHTLGVDDLFQYLTPDGGVDASAGIVLGVSSTEFTKTASGAFMSATASFL